MILASSKERVFCYICMGIVICANEIFVLTMRLIVVRNIIRQELAFLCYSECTPAEIFVVFSAFVREVFFTIRMVCALIVDVIGTLALTLTHPAPSGDRAWLTTAATAASERA